MLGLKAVGIGVAVWFAAGIALAFLEQPLKAGGEALWYLGLLVQWVLAVGVAARWHTDRKRLGTSNE